MKAEEVRLNLYPCAGDVTGADRGHQYEVSYYTSGQPLQALGWMALEAGQHLASNLGVIAEVQPTSSQRCLAHQYAVLQHDLDERAYQLI